MGGTGTVVLDVDDDVTVPELVALIEERTGIPEYVQRLFYGLTLINSDAALDSETRIAECGIGRHTSLVLTVSGLGGGRARTFPTYASMQAAWEEHPTCHAGRITLHEYKNDPTKYTKAANALAKAAKHKLENGQYAVRHSSNTTPPKHTQRRAEPTVESSNH